MGSNLVLVDGSGFGWGLMFGLSSLKLFEVHYIWIQSNTTTLDHTERCSTCFYLNSFLPGTSKTQNPTIDHPELPIGVLGNNSKFFDPEN